jgi:D-proline reductase (dithiol) PrdB
MKDFDWVANDDIPWATLQQPVNQARMTIVSTGGLYTPEQEPFAIEDGDDVDESYRAIPADIDVSTLGIAHEHYDHQFAEEDRNVVFPLDRFRELAADGEVGELSPRAFSITGYIPAPNKLFETAEQIANLMLDDDVDAAFLTPV